MLTQPFLGGPIFWTRPNSVSGANSQTQEERKTAKFTHYALAATEEALDDAGWKPSSPEQKERTVRHTYLIQGCEANISAEEMQGVCLGSGIGNFDEIFDTSVAYSEAVRTYTNWQQLSMS